MRITGVTTHVVGAHWRNLVYVVVHTDEGIEGVGESRPVNNTEAVLGYLDDIVPAQVVGFDPFETEALVGRIWRDNYSRVGDVAMCAAAMLEMACWDIVGKALGQPVYRLLGGAVRDKIKAYANGWYTVQRTPEEFHAAARRVVERGYRGLKVDPFGAGWYELELAERSRSIELVEAVRDAIGPEADLMVEMHGRFTPSEAIAIAREIEPFRPTWIEEPVPPDNIKALKKVAESVTAPIATGERIHVRHEFREVLELQAADVIQPDLAMCGGIGELRKIAAWAEAYYVLVAPHNVCGPVATAAALHVAAVTPNFKVQEFFNDFSDDWVTAVAPGGPPVVDGFFSLPTAPGLGVAFDPEYAAEHPRDPVRFELFRNDWHLRSAGEPTT